LRIWLIWIRAIVELSYILEYGDEALHMLFRKLDLFHLLRSGDGGMKKSKREKPRKQHTEQSPKPGNRVSVSNYRHGWASI
jgi:hypothetical protein